MTTLAIEHILSPHEFTPSEGGIVCEVCASFPDDHDEKLQEMREAFDVAPEQEVLSGDPATLIVPDDETTR